jgi:selenocysteine lyase/cysteine desulfurase
MSLQSKSQGVLNPEVPAGPNSKFPIEVVRAAFPALTRPPEFIFFDNAAGAQVPRIVLDAVNHHLVDCNVQRGGRYGKSREVDATILRARQSVADLVNARDASEIAFGMNATSFIRLVSLAIGQTLDRRNEIVVTDMDHEANVATWLALERSGATSRWCRLKLGWWRARWPRMLSARLWTSPRRRKSRTHLEPNFFSMPCITARTD